MYRNCYRCGQPGHNRAECPLERSVPAAAPASGRSAVSEFPPPVPPRRPAEEIACYAEWAGAIRTALGWDADSHMGWSRRMALEQVKESRQQRGDWVDHILTALD